MLWKSLNPSLYLVQNTALIGPTMFYSITQNFLELKSCSLKTNPLLDD